MSGQSIALGARRIGPEFPPYIIAELSANHNGEVDRAKQTIDMVKAQGADAVKIQTYTADTMTIDCGAEDFQIHGGLWDGYNLYQLYQEAHTPFEWHKPLFDHARQAGITVFSTPFDETAVDLLEDLNAPAYKIASFEVGDLSLLEYVAQTGKPMIISTGLADLSEIAEAVETVRENGCNDLVLLHCISSYPAPVDQCNLNTIPDLAERFNVISGLSDHTLGTCIAVASVALGARVIEKHVTLSRNNKGPDSKFSIEPEELNSLCIETKNVWSALGKAGYERKPAEQSNQKFRRSIYVVDDMKEGEIFTERNIRRIRPGFGLEPKYYRAILGKAASMDLRRGTAFRVEFIKKH